MSGARLKELIGREDRRFAAEKSRTIQCGLNTKATQPYRLLLRRDQSIIPRPFKAVDDPEAQKIAAVFLDLEGEMTPSNFNKSAKALMCGRRQVFPPVE